MSEVRLRYNKRKQLTAAYTFDASTAETVAQRLRKIVADALTCSHPDGQLSAKEVEVEVSEIGREDQTEYDFHIIIIANDYLERRINLDERRQMIVEGVRQVFDKSIPPRDPNRRPKGFVRVLLCPGSFGEV